MANFQMPYELAWLSRTLKQTLNKDNRDTRAFLKSPEGREYFQKLVDIGHPLAILFLSFPEKINLDNVSVTKGAVRADYFRFVAEQPFDIKDDEGNVVVTLQPNELFLNMHVVENADDFKGLSDLEKIRKFKQSFQLLLQQTRSLEGRNPTESITPDSVILGVSHLVRLFSRVKTENQIVWNPGSEKLPIPQPIINQIVRSSQEVSQAFGGTSNVQESDIKILCARASNL